MEQLIHVFGLDWKLLLIQVVNFLILLGVLSYFLYRPILNLMEKRQKEIEEGVLAAREAEEDRARAREEHTEVISKAEKEAEGIVGRAMEDGKAKEVELIALARAQEGRILKEAEMRATELARRIETESKEHVARAAVLAAEKILRHELSK
jgi:F-type H+-transporting ATPase subunit b